MNEMQKSDEVKIARWIESNIAVSEIEKELAEHCLSEDEIIATVRAYKKIKYANRHAAGIACVIAGAVTALLSCVLAITNPVPELFNIFLFGITPVAIIILFVGLFLLFE